MSAPTPNPDIIIHGAGIAGLWIFHRLKNMGYDVLLLERDAIGAGQTLASQGIIHSGLKYAIAGQVNDLAKQISKMPDLWRAALKGEGEINLSSAGDSAQSSQFMMIPDGFMGGLTKVISKKILGDGVREIPKDEWPEDVKNAGFKGSLVHMDEPVLDITKIIRALADPYKDSIRRAPSSCVPRENGDLSSLNQQIPASAGNTDGVCLNAKLHIYTAAASNHDIAKAHGHDNNLTTQARPLLMGMMKPAPFHLNAHLVGASEKPVATITTHTDHNGDLVWYLGGAVAERAKDADPQTVIDAATKGLKTYLPNLDLSTMQWATLPIDRIEGKSGTKGWMPDTPTLHAVDNHLYCWPTKLTFAPLLFDKVLEHVQSKGIKPSQSTSDFSALTEVDYAPAPWDKASWTR